MKQRATISLIAALGVLLAPFAGSAQLATPDVQDPLMADFLSATPAAPPAMVKARQHFFGAENVKAPYWTAGSSPTRPSGTCKRTK